MQRPDESYHDYLRRLAQEQVGKRVIHLDDGNSCTIAEAERNYALRHTTRERRNIARW